MSNIPLEVVKNWRTCFTEGLLSRGEGYFKQGRVTGFVSGEREAGATVITKVKANDGFTVRIKDAPDSYDAFWNPGKFSCNCAGKYTKTIEYNGKTRHFPVCAHEAAVLFYWENQRGPWKFQETPEAMEARLRQEWIEAEKRRRAEQKSREQDEKLPAALFFPEPDDETFFNIRAAVKTKKTNRYYYNRGQAVLREGEIKMEQPELSFSVSGVQVITASATVNDGVETRRLKIILSSKSLDSYQCSCRTWYDSNLELCDHVLASLTTLREYIRRENPGDATDQAADEFFRALDEIPSGDDTARTREAEKERNLTLAPYITMDGGEILISFKAGFKDAKSVILRSYKDFLNAVEEEKVFDFSKTVSADFSRVDFTEDSLPWLSFIQRRVSETDVANQRFERAGGYYYSPTISVGARDMLTGATLDRFYEIAEGTDCEFQDKILDLKGSLHIGTMPMRVRLKATRIAGGRNEFQGVRVTGEMPRILRGSAGSYILNLNGLSRITKEEDRFLRPFRRASDSMGHIRFQVGKNHLAEFYYRTVPRFLESPLIDFEDKCEKEAAPFLPPEPAFIFRMDIAENMIFCDVLVSYGDGEPKPMRGGGYDGEYHDAAQEKRVDACLRAYFHQIDFNSNTARYAENASSENLYRILTEALPELERYGEVLGSEAFRRTAVRPAPKFQVNISVSVDSGLLDLSILSKDADPEELLEILESYRQKKHFHRLKSGDFISLSDDDQFSSLKDLIDGLDVTAEDVILHGAEMPIYRALYLDRLLKEHDALASARDRTYRALIRNFASIRDADYEVPDAQTETLRPYQIYGYKWLRTLAAAGFGGILADEMGLGKTVQTIALIQSIRDEGNHDPVFVICPASLVFNWQEEFARFAPGLTVTPIVGSVSARKAFIQNLSGKNQDKNQDKNQAARNAVYITSYDLLRKDIALYENARFAVMILDEAQYIKNQKAALTKAVKAVRADHRFALTGTPVENRLAELWSIFDFLMPGFIYDYTKFSRRFETPITKNHDEAATARLKQLTGPFILRRLKSDVLKDLPAKLEEVRYSRFESKQREIYDGQVIRMKQLLTRSGETGRDKIKIFAELTRIRQICCDPSLLFENYAGGSAKREACLELIQNAITGGHRMLVFSQFVTMLDLLEKDLNKAGIAFYKITGATSKEQRLRLVRNFNDGDTPVFLISLKAGGTGLNLTGADVVIHYDPWWNAAAQNQATDRAHRIGQTRQVTVYRMIVKDTIEEKILAMQEAKRDLAEAILSGESASIASLSNEELLELLS